MSKEYALYKNEELLCIGTVREIAKKMNIKVKTVLFYKTPSYIKRRTDANAVDYRMLVPLDDEDDLE